MWFFVRLKTKVQMEIKNVGIRGFEDWKIQR